MEDHRGYWSGVGGALMLLGWGSAVYWVIAVETSSDKQASVPVLPVAGLIVIGFIGFYAMLVPLLRLPPWQRPAVREVPVASTAQARPPTKENQFAPEHAVSVIRSWHTEHASVDIEYVSVDRRPLAKEIDDWFALSGWRRDFGTTPQPFIPYFEGVRVEGYSQTLVDAVVVGLRNAGLTPVTSQVNTPTAKDLEPSALQRLWVTVGYEPAS